MTASGESPFNDASNGNVGVQGQYVTVEGDVTLTVAQDASPAEKYKVGAEHLRSRNPGEARRLIWEAMMGRHKSSEVLFHWLVAMLSDRTVSQFSKEEIGQLRHYRAEYAEVVGDPWADGVRLIYRLLASVLSPSASKEKPADMPLLVKQFETLAEKQRELIRPHLELFLDGPLKDQMWRSELERAQAQQCIGNRPGRAWMFFQPKPAMAILPAPEPAWVTRADQQKLRISAALLVASAGYLGGELLWHGIVLGVLAYVTALVSGVGAARADLDWRFVAERRRRKENQFRAPSPPTPGPSGDMLADRVDALFRRYFRRRVPDKAERDRWETAVAGFRKFHRDEIISMCRTSGASPDEMAWLIRYQVRHLNERWQDGRLREYQRELVPRRRTAATRQIGLVLLAIGTLGTGVLLWEHPLAAAPGFLVAIPSAVATRCRWLRVSLEHRRHDADDKERAQRQADINEEFAWWSKRLELKPKDAEMAAWLECDRTVLLGKILDHFHVLRSRLDTHAFLEEPAVGVKRARVEGGPLRCGGYRILMFLLAEDGVRQVRASLDFMTGTLNVRERISYRYDAIVSVRVVKEARRGLRFELRLAAGDPIVVNVRESDPGEPQHEASSEPTEETESMEEDPALDVASVSNTLHVLEGVAAEGRRSFQGRARAEGWPG